MLTLRIVSVTHWKLGISKGFFHKKYSTVNHCEYQYSELLEYGSLENTLKLTYFWSVKYTKENTQIVCTACYFFK